MEVDIGRLSSPIESESDYYQRLAELGHGSFGKVYKVLDVKSKEIIALKIISKKKTDDRSWDALLNEAKILESLDHPNIVKFKHIRQFRSRIYIGMELLEGGRLDKYIEARGADLKDFEAAMIMKSIFQAISYLHL